MGAHAPTMRTVDVLQRIRRGLNVSAVHRDAKKPFRFLLAGDPRLVAELRLTLLRGHDAPSVPLDAAATLETVDPYRTPTFAGSDIRCVLFVGGPGDAAGARLDLLAGFRVPILAVTVDAGIPPSGPPAPPARGQVAHYVIPAIELEALRSRVFPHIVECCKGVEIAVGRRLPALREAIAAKLTRNAANAALRVAGASAVVDHVPLMGFILGAVASAGDMVAITAIQVMLMMQIGAAYGKDPDVQRVWEMLPIVGGGFGWRMLARELSGFIPIAGIFIKGAIAYAGTMVVGEGVNFYYMHGRHMSKAQAAALYDETKATALQLAREFFTQLRRRP